jgi:hypothetical protein
MRASRALYETINCRSVRVFVVLVERRERERERNAKKRRRKEKLDRKSIFSVDVSHHPIVDKNQSF